MFGGFIMIDLLATKNNAKCQKFCFRGDMAWVYCPLLSLCSIVQVSFMLSHRFLIPRIISKIKKQSHNHSGGSMMT